MKYETYENLVSLEFQRNVYGNEGTDGGDGRQKDYCRFGGKMTEFPENTGDKVVIGRLIRQNNPDPNLVEQAFLDIDKSFDMFLKFVDGLADTDGIGEESVSYARKFRELYQEGKISIVSCDEIHDPSGIYGNSLEVGDSIHTWVEIGPEYYTGFYGTNGRKAQTFFATMYAIKNCIIEATSAFLAGKTFLSQSEFSELMTEIDRMERAKKTEGWNEQA